MTDEVRDKHEEFYALYIQVPNSPPTSAQKYDTQAEAEDAARKVLSQYTTQYHRNRPMQSARVYIMKAKSLAEYIPPEVPETDIKVSNTRSPAEMLEKDQVRCDSSLCEQGCPEGCCMGTCAEAIKGREKDQARQVLSSNKRPSWWKGVY